MFDWFDLNPNRLPNASLQQWIMLFGAGTLGFIIGYISRKKLIAQLEGDLASTERALADCYQTIAAPEPAQFDNDVVLQRIKTRALELDFNRIGIASPDEADDLKIIHGIGPFLEKKLHAIGIYTFRQVANFTKEDVDRVNDIIEFFPGRIERDNWVGQSAELLKKT